MRDLLFDVPWWLPTILAIIGLALHARGHRRPNRRLREAGAAVVLLAVVWALVSYLVDTPKEICRKQTRELVRSVVARDWKTFDDLLSSSVRFVFTGSSWRIEGHDTLSSAIKADIEQIDLKSATITAINAAEADAAVTVTITVWSNQDFTLDRPIDSEWEMEWRQVGSAWKLQEIRALRVAGVKAEQVRGSLRQH